jgi:CRP-like cAMP-binding protein
MALAPDPRDNRLLAALPHDVLHRWYRHLECCTSPLGQVLCESGAGQRHAYFPTSAIVSLMGLTEDGQSTEIAVVGQEGVVGISLFMGGGSTTGRAVVQSAGQGFRLAAHVLMHEFNQGGVVMHLMLRYTQALITQMAQTAICNRHHRVEQQLCRCLLNSLDRRPGNELVMTQELMASMLGVRREGVTEAALKLQRAGVISYARGHIAVLDRDGLLERACECYGVVKKEYDRLLPPPPRWQGAA